MQTFFTGGWKKSESLEFPSVLLVSLAWSAGTSLENDKQLVKHWRQKQLFFKVKMLLYFLRAPAARTMALWWLNRFIMAALLLSFTVLFELEVEGSACFIP